MIEQVGMFLICHQGMMVTSFYLFLCRCFFESVFQAAADVPVAGPEFGNRGEGNPPGSAEPGGGT